jgi:hypothetical protein
MVDLHRFDELNEQETGGVEVRPGRLIDSLIEEFAASPEGQELADRIGDKAGGWIYPFLDYGFRYEGFTPLNLDPDDVHYLIEVLLPKRVTLIQPEEADEMLWEFISFWEYLQRAYQLPNAEGILRYLRSVSPAYFREAMFDPERVGIAKSFVMAGLEAGYDMSNQEEINAFMQIYNQARIAEMHAQGDLGMGLPVDETQRRRTEPSKQKKRRKMAKASRRTNRKPKKKKKKKRK